MQVTLACWAFAVMAQAAAAPAAPLTLRGAIAEALARSPLLGSSADQIDVSATNEQRAKAAFAPNVTPTFRIDTGPTGATERALGVDLTKRFSFGTVVTMSVAGRDTAQAAFLSRDVGYTLSISQPLLRGFGSTGKAPLDQARRDVVSARRADEDRRRDVIMLVAAAYLDALQAQRTTVEAGRAVERASRLRKSSAARVAVGLATELDVSRAEWLQSQAEAAQLDVADRLADARDRLARLMGRPLSLDGNMALDLADADLTNPSSLLDAFVPPSPVPRDADRVSALIAMAIAARTDAAEARDRVRDAERMARVARWDLLPQLNLEVGHAHAGLAPSTVSAPLLAPVNGWRVGLSTDYSLNRAAASANAANAAIGVRAMQRAASELEWHIADEVRRADRDWTRTAASIELQTRAVQMAERQLRLAGIRYERGVAGNFDVTDAETNLYQAQTSLVAAQAAHALAGLTLRRVTGALDPEAVR